MALLHAGLLAMGDTAAFAAVIGRLSTSRDEWTALSRCSRRLARERFSLAQMAAAYETLLTQRMQRKDPQVVRNPGVVGSELFCWRDWLPNGLRQTVKRANWF